MWTFGSPDPVDYCLVERVRVGGWIGGLVGVGQIALKRYHRRGLLQRG